MAEPIKTIYSPYYDPNGWIQIREADDSFFDDKPIVTDPVNGMIVNYSHYTKGFTKSYHKHSMSHAVYVIDGVHRSESNEFGPGSLVLDPVGYACSHGATEDNDCKFIWITNKAGDIQYLDKPVEKQLTNRKIEHYSAYSAEGWEKLSIGDAVVEIQRCIKDAETGASVSFVRIPAGMHIPTFELSCNSGIFIIRGSLDSDLFRLEENTFLWMPAGYRRTWNAGNQGCLLMLVENTEGKLTLI